MTIGGAVIQGRYSNRWSIDQALPMAGSRLENLATQVPGWRLSEVRKFAADVVGMLQCAGHVCRVYTDEETGQQITVAVIVGPAGPTSVHIPEICYSSRDYDIESRRQHVKIKGPGPDGSSADSEHEFWNLTLRSLKPGIGLLDVAYAWTGGGPWQAPAEPRISMRHYPALYKIQVAAPLPPGIDPMRYHPCEDFLRDFLPILEQVTRAESREPSAESTGKVNAEADR
jgi:hypothetical protein